VTRDTKIGLLVGLAFIILFGIILSEKGASKQGLDTPQFAAYKPVVELLPGEQTQAPQATLQLPPVQSRYRLDRRPVMSAKHARPLTVANQPVGDPAPGQPQSTSSDVANPSPVARPQTPPAARQPSQPELPATPLRRLLPRPQSNGLAQAPPAAEQPVLIPAAPVAPGRPAVDRAPAELPKTSVADAAATGATTEYVVREGETLIGLCRRFYGKGSLKMVNRILALNQSKLSKPELLRAGQKIIIPVPTRSGLLEPVEAPTVAAVARQDRRQIRTIAASGRISDGGTQKQASSSVQADSPSAAQRWYTVRENDTLFKIAKRTLGSGAAWKKVYQANKERISDPDLVVAGSKILIPTTEALASN